MQQHIAAIRARFNDDDEIIARIDELERLKAECKDGDCPFTKMISIRVLELKRALVDHWLF